MLRDSSLPSIRDNSRHNIFEHALFQFNSSDVRTFWGTVSSLIIGWLLPYANPATSIGLLTFLSPTMAALTSGLFLFNRWKEAALIFAAELIIWFAHPFAVYEAMPIINGSTGLLWIFLIIPPVRKWIIKTIMAQIHLKC